MRSVIIIGFISLLFGVMVMLDGARLLINSTQEVEQEKNQTLCGDQIIYTYLIFDAGSTKTRLYMYSFTRDIQGKISLVQTKDIGRMTALSELGIEGGETSLRKEMNELLNDARSHVETTLCPQEVYVYLRATAGLRSLPEKVSERILKVVRDVFMRSIYKYVGNQSADIMSGGDEGFWLWVFMNYAMGNLETCNPENKVTTFDLGGGSTQLATLASNIRTIDPEKNENIIHGAFNNCNYDVYSISYESFGAQATRKKFFGENLMSDCIAGDLSLKFKFGNFEGTLKGVEIANSERYSKCMNKAKEIVNVIHKVWRDTDVPKKLEFVSAFYYIPKSANAIINNCTSFEDEGCDLGKEYSMNISRLKEFAESFCEKPINDPQVRENFQYSEYLCIDLVYIISLLTDGYGIKNQAVTFHMVEEIDELKVGWPLGFAYGLYAKNGLKSMNYSLVSIFIISLLKIILFRSI